MSESDINVIQAFQDLKQPAKSKDKPATKPGPDQEADPEEKALEAADKALKTYKKRLMKLANKALRELERQLKEGTPTGKVQAALGITRVNLRTFLDDMSPLGGGAEIHIHTSHTKVIQGQAPAPPRDPGKQPQAAKRTGKPIYIVK